MSINKTRTATGSVNLQRSYEICKAVVEKSANRARVEAQLVPPPNKQRRLSASQQVPVSLSPGTTFVVATSLPASGQPLGQRLAVGQPMAVRAVRPPMAGGQPLTGAIRLRLPASAVQNSSGGQVIIQRSALPAPVLQQLVTASLASSQPQAPPQAIMVRAANSLTSVSGLVRASPTLMLSSQPSSASVSLTTASPSSSQYIVHSASPLSPAVTRLTSPLAGAQPLASNNISNSVNLSGLAPIAQNTSTTFLSSVPSVPSSSPQQFIIRYLPRAPQPGLGQAPIFLQPLGSPDKVSPMHSPLASPLQVSPASPQQIVTRIAGARSPGVQIIRTPPPTPPPGSPKTTKSFNPTMIIQAITKPCTPPPSSPAPVQSSPPLSSQRMVFRATRPSIQRIVIPSQKAENNFTKPLPPIQTSNIKTVRTTLVPRSPVSDDQISNILQAMVPEPQAMVRINEEEKEKASAVAALAAHNFDEGKLSPTKMMSPGLPSGVMTTPSSPQLPIIQPLEIQENGGTNGTQSVEDSSLDNILIPEIPESLGNLDKKPLDMPKSQIVLKVSPSRMHVL